MVKDICIIACLLLSFLQQAGGQDIRFRKITSSQGLSHNTVYAIAQDQKGCMWFGTREGLNKYDSDKLKNYYIQNSKLGGSANKISSLLWYNSLLYIGTDNGLYIYDAETDQLQESKVFPDKLIILFLYELQGDIYIGTVAGLHRISKNKHTRISSAAMAAKAMCAVSEDYLLIALGSSLKIINKKGETVRIFDSSSLPELGTADFNVFNIYKDKKEQIWLSTNQGLFNFNSANQRFLRLRFSASETAETYTVRSVLRKNNTLYIGTENGLYTYNIQSGESENYQQSFNHDPKMLNDKAVYSTCLASDGSVWIGTYFGGINYIPSNTYGFRSIMPNDKDNGLKGKAISQLMEDSKRRIWISTEDGGISIYNPAVNSYTHINKESFPFYLTINNVHAIHDDGYGNIWVGTFMGGLHRFDTRKNTTTVYSRQPGNPSSLSNDMVYAIYRDSRGKLWIGTQSGLNLFDYKTKKFSLFKPKILGNKFIYDLAEDKNGDLWFCTRQNGIYRYNPVTQKIRHYTAAGSQPVLSSNQIISVYKDSRQQLWFGTLDGGVNVYNIDQDKFKNYTIADGLANNNVYGILEDDNGIIWLTTNRGISRFNPKSNKFINYDTRYGLPSNQFNFKSYLKTGDGVLYFGSINGLCVFNPSAVITSPFRLPLIFTDFQLFNKSIVPGSSSILKNQIDYSDKVKLNYNQNAFTINYTAINYAAPGSANYAFYLEGFDDKWNYVENKNSVTYTNLSPGKYVFHIKAVNPAGVQNSVERTLEIYVAPPFYLSYTAYFIYFLLLSALIWLYTRFVRFLHQKKLEIQLERVEKEKTKELSQHRLNFFTFISHEFKTPLTLILALIDKFIEEKGTEFKKNPELSGIKNNASILFKLIQQLMEFRKIETEHAAINLTRSDIVDFIRTTAFSFETVTAKKCIKLDFFSSEPVFECYFDKNKIEQIVFNIISNAVKNTSSGKIEVKLNVNDQDENTRMVSILVEDTGKGMSAKELKNIFNPFYTVSQKKTDSAGSGVGLALVDSLVKYLNGKIVIKSEPEKGTSIEIILPVIVQFDSMMQEKNDSIPAEETISGPDKTLTDTTLNFDTAAKYTLLIVEDNKELLTFLSKHFAKHYHVHTASNGVQALKKINKMPPDIVVSDVKMPRMDGLELCSRIKTDKKFNYIPVVLLSDNNAEHSKMNGLDIGADAYISKPFNLKEFELLIQNMIKSRVKLREHVIGIGSFIEGKLPRNNRDQEFLMQLSKILEENFASPSITVEDIARQLNMSRTLLHLNLKRLLNKSANELLNDFRLEKAVVMLENDLPINETAYYCGYSDPNYFSRIFKKKYTLTPKQYKSAKADPDSSKNAEMENSLI